MSKRIHVDFRAVKAAVSMSQILDHYGLTASFKASANGENLSGPCPLHGGDNPTQFRVSLTKNCWHCFSECQHGGNILDFVAKKEDCSIRQAAILLSNWFNLPTDGSFKSSSRDDEEGTASREASASSAQAAPAAQDHGRSVQAQKHNAQVPEEDTTPNKPLGFALKNLDSKHPYLGYRGLSATTIAEFGLGFCAKGTMAGRIAIPIHNEEGQLVAYAGRWPGELPKEDEMGDTPKYRFPAGFKKSQELFNLHRALRDPSDRPLVLVEGFFGCMHLWQIGLRRVVALMGSSLSQAQEELLVRHTDSYSQVMVMLDEDPAGRAGRENIAQRLSLKLFVRVFSFLGKGEGAQPESLSDEDLMELLE